MFHFRPVSIAFLLLVSASSSWGQMVNISGRVMDAPNNNSPIPGASVIVSSTGAGALTDINGNYSIPNVPVGDDLTVSLPGYHAASVAVTGDPNVNIYMYPIGFSFSSFYSRQSGDWEDPETWSYISHTGPPADEVPGATGHDAIIGSGHTVTMNEDVGLVGDNVGIRIDVGGTLNAQGYDIYVGGDFSILGTLQNAGNFYSTFGNADIYTNGQLPVFNQIILTHDPFFAATTRLQGDVVVLNGVVVNGGTFDPNGFTVFPCIPPSATSTNAMFSNHAGSSMTLSWTRGNGDGVLVVGRLSGTPQSHPVFGTNYAANANFGSGHETIPGSGCYVLYNGTGSSVNITGLQPLQYYEFGIYEYSNSGLCYNISNFLGASEFTGCFDPGSPANPVGAAYCAGSTPAAISVDDPGSGRNIYWYTDESGETYADGDVSGGSGRGEVFIPSAPGTYYAVIHDGTFGCESFTRIPVTLTEYPVVNPGTTTGNQAICSGGDPVAIVGGTATGGDGSYTYQWESSTVSSTGPYTIINGEESATYDPPAGISTTTHFRRITISSTCTPQTGNFVTVNVTTPSVVIDNPDNQTACAGGPATFRVDATGSPLYAWQVDAGSGFSDVTGSVYSGIATNQLQISDATGLNNFQYRCKITSGPCTVFSQPATLSVNPAPTAINQTPSVCETSAGSGTAIVNLNQQVSSITGGQANVTVSWFHNADLSSAVSTPGTVTVGQGQLFYAQVTNTQTSCHAVAQVTYTVNAAPVAVATPTNATICSGGNTGIALSGATSFSWTVSPNSSISGAVSGSGTAINQTLTSTSTVQQQITYSVTPSNGCTGQPINVVVSIQPPITAFNLTGADRFCSGSGGISIGLSNSQPGITYQLYHNGTPTNNSSTPGGGAFNFPSMITQPGAYTVRGTNALDCSANMNGTKNIVVDSAPSGNGIIQGNTAVCNGRSETYTVAGVSSNPNNPTIYTWDFPQGITSPSSTGNPVTVNINGGNSGTISVTWENNCGAGGSAQLNVQLLSPPDVSIVLPEEPYANEVVVFDYASSFTINNVLWNFGDNTTSSDPSHVYLSGGAFNVSVEVTDTRGCTNTAENILVIRPAAQLDDKSIKNVITANGDDKNAYLYIYDIHKFPDNEVILLDRWGVEVFRAKGYNNTWDLSKDGNYLPAGNYVCIVRLGETGAVYSRAVTVIKGK